MAAIRVYVTRFEHKNFFLFGENPFAATFGGNQYQRVSAIKGILSLNTFAKLGRRSRKVVPMNATYSADCLFDLFD